MIVDIRRLRQVCQTALRGKKVAKLPSYLFKTKLSPSPGRDKKVGR